MRVNFIGLDVVLFLLFLFFYIFDDLEFDCRNFNEWLELGFVDGKQYLVLGKVFLLRDDGKNGREYVWIDVGILDYDVEK